MVDEQQVFPLKARVGSPDGPSTLTTSAPRSAKRRAQYGADTFVPSSTTRLAPIASVSWRNAPVTLGPQDYSLASEDGVQFELLGGAAYDAIFASGLSTLEFEVQANCGAITTFSMPLTLAADPPPLVNLTGVASGLILNQGEQRHITASLSDASRNISQLQAHLFAPGDTTAPVATLATQAWGDEPIDRDAFSFRLPIRIDGSVPVGSWELRPHRSWSRSPDQRCRRGCPSLCRLPPRPRASWVGCSSPVSTSDHWPRCASAYRVRLMPPSNRSYP